MTSPKASQEAEELLPCPKCGRAPKRNGRLGSGGVICRHSDHLFQVYGKDQAEADERWNTRDTSALRNTILEEAAGVAEQRIALIADLAPEAANAVLYALPDAIRQLGERGR